MPSAEAQKRLIRLVDEGRNLHLAGDLSAAERLLREALSIEPEDPESLHRLGMILDSRGEYDAAIELMQRSILRAPTVPEFFNNLGEAFRKSLRRGEAQRAYERALQLRPSYPDALNNVALVMLEIGDKRALACARNAAQLAPDVPQIRVTLGRALYATHDHRAAIAELREAIRLSPDNADAHQALIASLAAAGDPIDSFVSAPPAGLDVVEVHNAVAEGYLARARADLALEHLNAALAIDPNHISALAQLGSSLIELGQSQAALDALHRAASIRDVPGLHQTMAFAYLALGQLAEGFREYENRPKGPPPLDRGRAVPQWTGAEPVSGKTVLLIAEQGAGDTIQFIRYAPLLAARGAKVLARVGESFLALARTVKGIDQVYLDTQPVKNFDLFCPMASLPRAFGTRLETIPGEVPYLHADAEKVKAWRERFNLENAGALKVGVVWQGNPRHPRDRARSIPLAMLAPLASVPNVKLYSLQKNEGREQLAKTPIATDLSDELKDFQDTAAAITALDLVIAVDTSVAHLAGSLGARTWTLIALPTDWRWLLDREDSPWYPTMRLYRQRTQGDWGEVVGRIVADLASLAKESRE